MDHALRLSIPVQDLRPRADSRRGALERDLAATEGVLSAAVSPLAATVELTVDPAEVDEWTLVRVINRSGLHVADHVHG